MESEAGNMKKYTSISEVSNSIVKLLRDNMVPEVIMNPDSINLCSPAEKGDAMVGVYLYDIRENENIREVSMINNDINRQKHPSTYLSLYYMITAYSNSDVKFKQGEEQKILGRVIQIMKDNSLLDNEDFQPVKSAKGMNLRIYMLSPDLEEKQRIWNVPNTAYKVSLFYQVAPVEIESTKEKHVQRVVEIDITVKE